MTNPDAPTPAGNTIGVGLLGGLLATGAGLYNSYQDRKTAKENTERTIQANKELAEWKYQADLEAWRMQMAYNTPEAQMQRFREAGLNPHLIYGRGDTGNASAPPQYQAPHVQYNYAPARYGAAIAQILPTLMEVGSWMQSMRMAEVELKKKEVETVRSETATEQARQLIEFLEQKYPRELQKLDQENLGLFPYQQNLLKAKMQEQQVAVADALEEFRYKFGSKLELPGEPYLYSGSLGGARAQQLAKLIGEAKVAQMRGRYADMGIADPTAIMTLVGGGVMKLAQTYFAGSRKVANRPVTGDRAFNETTRRLQTFFKGRR